jgi:hypothetical protein
MAIKMAKYYDSRRTSDTDVLTDSMEMYASRLEEMRAELGAYSPLRAAVDHQRYVLGMGIDDGGAELLRPQEDTQPEVLHMGGEQQGKTSEELNAQWYDPTMESSPPMADLMMKRSMSSTG